MAARQNVAENAILIVRPTGEQPGKRLALKGAMIGDELRGRTRAFAIEIISLCLDLGTDDLARLVRPQLLRSGTGVATNYRAACRGRSSREFASRLGIVVEESDESEFWLDILEVFKRGSAAVVARLRQEAAELRAITARSRTTTLDRIRRERQSRRPRRKHSVNL